MYQPQKFDPPWVDFFERPCPYYFKQYLSFHKFSLLPPELQLLIWEVFEPEPQRVTFYGKRDVNGMYVRNQQGHICGVAETNSTTLSHLLRHPNYTIEEFNILLQISRFKISSFLQLRHGCVRDGPRRLAHLLHTYYLS